MGKLKKSTRKFNQKHLKTEISRRRRFQKRGAGKSAGIAAGTAKAGEAFKQDGQKKKKNVEDLEVDELLGGDFLESDRDDASDEGDLSDDLPSDMDSAEDSEDELDGEGEDDDDAVEDGNDADVAGEEAESSDEEADEGGDEAVKKDNKRLRAEIQKHKAQLESLQAKDPEFYKYLQQTNPELLGFGEGEEEAESEDEEEVGKGQEEDGEEREEKAEEQEEEEKPGVSDRTIHVTSSLVQQWCSRAKVRGSLGAMRQLVKAYRVAAHYGDSEDQVESTLRISSSAVFNRLMLFMLNNADSIFLRLLSLDKKAVVTPELVKSSPRYKKVEPLIKSYLGNTIHLMSQMTESGMTAFVLRRIRPSAVFLAPYAKLQRRCLKQALTLFGGAEHSVRLQAFLLIRHLAITLPPPVMDRCMTGTYQTFLANAKFMTAASAPHINFMGACIVELWGLDSGAAYQHTFQAIKQLAVVLRNALCMKTKEGHRDIYSWQTINCLELWARVLGAYAGKTQLRVLVYPLTQLLITSSRLVPNPRYFPLRLRLVRALNRLAADADVYIPVAPLVLDILGWAELSRAPTGGTHSAPDMQLQLRASKNTLKATSFQEEVVLQVMELLAAHLSQSAYSVAFPELCHLPLTQLRKFAKTSPVERFRKHAKGLVDAIERNMSWVGSARSAVDFSPKHADQVQAFLQEEKRKGQAPLHQYALQLQSRAQQRASMRSQEEVKLGKRSQPDEDSDEEAEGKAATTKKRGQREEAAGKKAKQGAGQEEDQEFDGDEDEDGYGSEDEDEDGDLLDEVEEEEEEVVPPPKEKKKKKGKNGGKQGPKQTDVEKAAKTTSKKSQAEDVAMDIPDVLQDFQLSSDDDEGDMDGIMDVDDDDDIILGEESD